jgi:predicted transposase YdaD
MRHPRERRVEVYARAVDGLLALEPDWNRQRKYMDFIDAYAALSEDEVARYSTEYIDTIGGDTMGGLATLIEEKRQESWQKGRQKGRLEGRQEGWQKGRQEGEAALLLRLMERRFGPLDETLRKRVQEADADTLLLWGERVLTAANAEDVIQDQRHSDDSAE